MNLVVLGGEPLDTLQQVGGAGGGGTTPSSDARMGRPSTAAALSAALAAAAAGPISPPACPPHPPALTLPPCEQWVAELFAAVPGGRGPRPQYGDAGFPYEGGRLYVLPAVRDEHRLTSAFQLPCLAPQYR